MSPSISLMPHRVCWAADPALIWTMVVTNAITFASYLTICLTLIYLVRHTRRVIARDWAWFCIGFALFIVACGTTHLMDVITTWIPAFWVDASVSILTAILSAVVAIMLIRRVGLIGYSINDYASRLANTEAEKQQLSESLLAARKLEDWSRMSATVAHEINNPLESIQNILYLIRSNPGVAPEVIELAATASEEADRVVTISRSTLSFFRQTALPEPIDLRLAVDSVRFVLEALMRSRSVHFETIYNSKINMNGAVSEKDFTVLAFAGEARQVLLNLVRNACEATTVRNTTITLTLTGHADGVELSLEDQGTGIAAETLDTLFQFGSTTKGEQGNGMGLWTVKHIVAKHGGSIRVDSNVGEGTRFTLWWPRIFANDAEAI